MKDVLTYYSKTIVILSAHRIKFLKIVLIILGVVLWVSFRVSIAFCFCFITINIYMRAFSHKQMIFSYHNFFDILPLLLKCMYKVSLGFVTQWTIHHNTSHGRQIFMLIYLWIFYVCNGILNSHYFISFFTLKLYF